jgi:hypothetical protein
MFATLGNLENNVGIDRICENIREYKSMFL